MTFSSGPVPQINQYGTQEAMDLLWQKFIELEIEFEVVAGLQMQSYIVAGVPEADPIGRLIYVSDEAGGAVPAFSDGTDWRRVTDRAIIS